MAERLKWNFKMEAAYEAAIKGVGGLEAAKPKAVHEAIVAEFPELTLQAVKWHLQSDRRRAAREKEQGPSSDVRWTGRLEEAYEAAVVQLGGIYSARPRDIHQALAAEFPELTVQSVKWHLYAQRRADARKQEQRQEQQLGGATRSGSEQPSSSAGGSRPGQKRRQQEGEQATSPLPKQEEEQQQQQRASSFRRGDGPAATLQLAAVGQQAVPPLSLPSAPPPLQQQQQQQQQQPPPPIPAVYAAAPGQPVPVQPPGWLAAAVLPGGPAVPWQPYVLPVACERLIAHKRRTAVVQQIVTALERQVEELVAMLSALGDMPGGGASAGGLAPQLQLPAMLQGAVAAAQPQLSVASGAAAQRLQAAPPPLGATSLGSGAAPIQKRAHDPATCTTTGCRLCSYERRRAQQPQAEGAHSTAALRQSPWQQQAGQQRQQQQQQGALASVPNSADAIAWLEQVLVSAGSGASGGSSSGGASSMDSGKLLNALLDVLNPHPSK